MLVTFPILQRQAPSPPWHTVPISPSLLGRHGSCSVGTKLSGEAGLTRRQRSVTNWKAMSFHRPDKASPGGSGGAGRASSILQIPGTPGILGSGWDALP
jgi:hypothetical protein